MRERVFAFPGRRATTSRTSAARAGDRIRASDGRGGLAALRLLAVGAVVEVEIESVERSNPTRTARLLCGAPEAQRADWLVEKLAELGIAGLQPIDCRRGAWKVARDRRERWRRLAIAALRQSRRRFVLEVLDPLPLDAALASVPPGASCWVADPIGQPASRIQPPVHGLSVGLVGPSGGFDAGERDDIRARGIGPMCLADGRLRTETAGLAWGAWWSAGGSPEGIESALPG